MSTHPDYNRQALLCDCRPSEVAVWYIESEHCHSELTQANLVSGLWLLTLCNHISCLF